MHTLDRSPAILPRRSRPQTVACGRFLFGYRDFLFPLVLVLLLLTTRPGMFLGSRDLDHWLDWLGFLVCLAGEGSRLLALGSVEGIRRRGEHGRIAATSLIRDGIFAFTRNPLYLGDWLIVFGLVLMADSTWWYLVVLPAFSWTYWAIVQAEEEYLAAKFDTEFSAYRASVPRFVPAWRGVVQVLRSPGFSWRRALGKDARVISSWLSAAIALVAWERWTHKGVPWPLLGVLLVLILMGSIPHARRSHAHA